MTTRKKRESSSDAGRRMAAEVLAAALGGALSSSVLYPLEVLKTLQAAAAKSPPSRAQDDSSSDEQESNEHSARKESSAWELAQRLYEERGLAVFFRGLEWSALQSALEKALYFIGYNLLQQLAMPSHPSRVAASLSTTTKLLLACVAEWMHLPVTLPVDAWTTRIQSSSGRTSKDGETVPHEGPVVLLCHMLAHNSLADWYKGWRAYFVLCLKPALQYTVYEQLKAWYLHSRAPKSTIRRPLSSPSKLSAAQSFFLAALARTIATLVVYPYVRAKVLLQASTKTSDESTTTSGDQSSSTMSIQQVLVKTYQEEGWAALYKGLGPEWTRGVLSAALMLMVKEQLTDWVFQQLR